jgi:ABC-2 type transport system ATP-binding protein
MKDVAIIVDGVSKSFRLPHEKHGSLKSLFVNIFSSRRTYERQQVLKDVSLEIKKGEFFGIIGRNGNGKSTLLKLLAGIYEPDKGQIAINGNLTPFIELGVGFNPELTGRENVYLNGALLGLDQKAVDKIYKDIVEFAELERFMDQKLKNYSSGMQVRLAFSIAIRAKAEILLIDEVLAVGDVNFQKKCIQVFEELKRDGRTIVFVSHSMGYVKDFCDRVAVINQGKVLYCGDASKAIDVYNKLNREKEAQDRDNLSKITAERIGTGGARIEEFKIFDKKGAPTTILETGEKYEIKIKIKYSTEVKNPALGVMFRKNPTENLYGINNHYEKINFGNKHKGDESTIIIEDKMPLNPGDYYLSLSIVDAKSSTDYEELDSLENITKLTVFSKEEKWALVNSSAKIFEE